MTDSINTLVSIIIPVFNSEPFLNKCLDSVIQQTYQYIEIILINDGSTDKSPKIIDEYASMDSRIVAIHKANGGIGSAYKAAFEVMAGDYVLFVDSDDWLELNAVERLLKLAVDNDADMVSFGIKAINLQGVEVNLKNFKNIEHINTNNEAILKTHFEVLKHPTLVRLYKQKLFNNIVVFDQNIGIDEMLTPQLLAKCNLAVYTSEVYYNVLVRQDSVCRAAYNEKKIRETIKVYRFLCNFFEQLIPRYAAYIQLKYLAVLVSFFHQSVGNKKLMQENTIKIVKKDLKDLYYKVEGLSLFQEESLNFRTRVLLVVHSPVIYKIIFNSLRLIKSKQP